MIERNSAETGGAFYFTGHGFFDNVTINNNSSQLDGGGIWSSSRLVIVDSTILNNRTLNNGEFTYGGGLSLQDGSVATITDTTLDGNSARFGGGLYFDSNTSATIESSRVSNGTASIGAGIFNNGTITVSNSTLTANSATSRGGGIFSDESTTIIGSTIHANSASDLGGGIENNDTLTVTNSTLSGNTATSGGGLLLNGFGDSVTSLNSVTIAFNAASDDGSGIYVESGASLTSSGSIIVLNGVNGDCFVHPLAIFTPLFANLDGDESCPGFITGAALLGPLVDNGGLTLTHMLGDASAAIDRGESTVCAALGNLDQRGVSRVNVDGNGNLADGNPCDLGAVEHPSATPPTSISLNRSEISGVLSVFPIDVLTSLLMLLTSLTVYRSFQEKRSHPGQSVTGGLSKFLRRLKV